MVAGVWKYDIKYSISALFWSQLPQTDTPQLLIVCMWVWVEICLGGKEEEDETSKKKKINKEKHLKTLSITVCYLE